MNVSFDFDSGNVKDLIVVLALGEALKGSAMALVQGAEKATSEVSAEPQPRADTEEKAQADVPVATEEKPKRRRTKKEKAEAEPEAEPEAVVSDLPFSEETGETVATVEPAEEAEAPTEEAASAAPVVKYPTMTKDEFAEINRAKRAELGLTVDGENSKYIRDFNVYCQRRSEMAFGNPKPSTLPAEELWQFAQWFKTIEMNPNYVQGSVDEETCYPFVSDVLSKAE